MLTRGVARFRRGLRSLGAAAGCAGLALMAMTSLGAGAGPAAVAVVANASTGPPCLAGELCVKESQVPTTAVGFGSSCGDLASAHPDEDLWHFVIPSGASFSTDTTKFTAIFTNPNGQVHADSIGGPGDKFAFVYSAAGATLTWAFATDVTGTSVTGNFVLSGTCAATTTSSTTSTVSTTTSTVSTTSTTETSTSASSTTTGGVSGSSTTNDGTTSTSSAATGSVQGISVTPNTGSNVPFGVGLGLVVGGFALVGLGRRGRRRTG